MSQTKFSNPVNPSTGNMSPSPSAESVKGGRGTTGAGTKTTHGQDTGPDKIGYAGKDEPAEGLDENAQLGDLRNKDRDNQGNQMMGVHSGGKRPRAQRNQNDQQERRVG